MLNYLEPLTLPTPFPIGPINCYLARGDELTLVDTGPQHPDTLESLRSSLAERGLAFKDIRRIIITHAHVDHFGLAASIVAESGARVFSHSRNRWWLTDFESEWERRYGFYHETFVQNGAPIEYADSVIRGMRRLSQFATSVPGDRFAPLEDRDIVRLGGDDWRVVFAPGHASGLICLYEPNSRNLISSDHLLRDVTSNPVLEPPIPGEKERPHALVDYLASMEKTAEIPVRIALPAHGQPIYDVGALVDARQSFHRSRLDHIEQQLGCCASTAFELCGILFPELKSFDMFLGLSEVIGHLDVLERDGRVRKEVDDGRIRYVPTKVA